MIINASTKRIVDVVYSKNEEFWRDFGEKARLNSPSDFDLIIKDITDVCFISGKGVGFRTIDGNKFQFVGLNINRLDYMANGFFFDSKANAKMWYCCLRYALENKDCVEFWEKYKATSAGSKFMALMLGGKELDS